MRSQQLTYIFTRAHAKQLTFNKYNFHYRYPFHGQEHTGLFAKIRRGQFTLPDSISSRAKCLIRCLLRKDPTKRLTTEDVLIHPWVTLSTPNHTSCHTSGNPRESRRVVASAPPQTTPSTSVAETDQIVPEFFPDDMELK